MDVELLYFDDCPNWRQTADLRDDIRRRIETLISEIAPA